MDRTSKSGCGILSLPLEHGLNKRPGGCGQPPLIGWVLETHHFANGGRQHVVDWCKVGRGRQGLFKGIVGHEEHRS